MKSIRDRRKRSIGSRWLIAIDFRRQSNSPNSVSKAALLVQSTATSHF